MRKLDIFASVLVLISACGSNTQADVGFDQALIEDPTLFVQDPLNEVVLEKAAIEPGSRHTEFGPESIDQAIQDLFERGDGDDLYTLKQALIPTAVWFGLEAGDGDPDAMIDTEWLGEIDGRIDTALNRTNYTPPAVIDEADVKRVIDAGLAPLIAESVGIEPTDEITTAISKTVATYNYNTGTGDSNEEQAWINENVEPLVQRYQLVKTLNDSRYIQIPPDLTVQQALEGQDRISISRIQILDIEGNPVISQSNETIVVSDWDEEFAVFSVQNDIVEKAE